MPYLAAPALLCKFAAVTQTSAPAARSVREVWALAAASHFHGSAYRSGRLLRRFSTDAPVVLHGERSKCLATPNTKDKITYNQPNRPNRQTPQTKHKAQMLQWSEDVIKADHFFGRSRVRFRVPPWVSITIARDHLP